MTVLPVPPPPCCGTCPLCVTAAPTFGTAEMDDDAEEDTVVRDAPEAADDTLDELAAAPAATPAPAPAEPPASAKPSEAELHAAALAAAAELVAMAAEEMATRRVALEREIKAAREELAAHHKNAESDATKAQAAAAAASTGRGGRRRSAPSRPTGRARGTRTGGTCPSRRRTP